MYRHRNFPPFRPSLRISNIPLGVGVRAVVNYFWSSDQLHTRTYIHVCCLPPLYLRPEYFTEVSSKGKLSPLKCLSENKFVLLKKRYSKSCTFQVINPSSIQFNAFKLANPIPRSVLFPIPSQRPSTSSEVSAIKDPSESENAHNAAGS